MLTETETRLGGYSGLVENEYILKPDGAEWRQFYIKGGALILTSAGQELIESSNQRELFQALRSYQSDLIERNQSGLGRNYFANGSNGEIYQVANTRIAIKESKSSQSLFSAINRMDHLSHVVQKHMPHWVRVVNHYGLLTSRLFRSEFLIMEMIDNGISLEDIASYVSTGNARTDILTSNVERLFPNLAQSEIDTIEKQTEEFEEMLRQYTQSQEADYYGDTFNSLLPDPNRANYLVERLQTPIGGKKHMLWVIDQ